MKKGVALLLSLVLVVLVVGMAEAGGPYYGYRGYRPGYGYYPRTTFSFGFNFLVPFYPYPSGNYVPGYSVPMYAPPPMYVPQCTIYNTPGTYRQVPWYTEPGGITTFRQEWVPPTTTQVCQ